MGLEEAKNLVAQAIDLGKLFPGFKTPDWVFAGVSEAVELMRGGEEAGAVSKLRDTARNVQNVLAAFFRNSVLWKQPTPADENGNGLVPPKTPFFFRRLAAMEEEGVHKDICQRVEKKLRELEDFARGVENLDLQEASRLYNEALEAFRLAREEWEGRQRNQREAKKEEKAAALEAFAEKLRRQAE